LMKKRKINHFCTTATKVQIYSTKKKDQTNPQAMHL
jgi:hypothetical protein